MVVVVVVRQMSEAECGISHCNDDGEELLVFRSGCLHQLVFLAMRVCMKCVILESV